MNSSLISVENVIKIRGVGRQARAVLRDVNLSLNTGEIVGLLGVNGAGKTTLSSIMATLHMPTSGRVLFRGVSVYDCIVDYRRVLGYCPQQPNFEAFLTVSQNLMFAGHYYGMPYEMIKTRVEQLLDQFELRQYADTSPGQLSGGYQRRLLVARALVHNPELLILDEPTVGMDPHARRSLLEILRTLPGQGVSVLLTTHYLDEVEKVADRICILDDGCITATGTLNELKQHFGAATIEEVFFAATKKSLPAVAPEAV